eukprot:gene18685-25205_t
MPLITDLRNPSMRERHWEQLMTEIGTKFDPFSPTFSLDSVVQLRLDQHAPSSSPSYHLHASGHSADIVDVSNFERYNKLENAAPPATQLQDMTAGCD